MKEMTQQEFKHLWHRLKGYEIAGSLKLREYAINDVFESFELVVARRVNRQGAVLKEYAICTYRYRALCRDLHGINVASFARRAGGVELPTVFDDGFRHAFMQGAKAQAGVR